MTTIKRIFKPLLSACFVAAFFSCNSADTTKATPANEADTTVKSPAASPAEAAFTPFDVLEISHTLKDYATWRPFFDTDSVNRKASGMENIVVGREISNPDNILIALKVADVEKAKAFTTDPKLKDVMQKAGVISKPGFEFFHVIRFNPDSKEKQWIVVTHKVKDFDAWLKAYDGEGTTQRLSEGMVDVARARGIDDPNIVHIVFDVTDMAKAKAAITSEAKKKLMMSAGVEGQPKIAFYQTAQ